jgi:hypothetical protein
MTKPEAFLECQCGSCRIILCDSTMRAHIECLCSDCRQRGLISASRNPGNSLPKEVANYGRGFDMVYFANALVVEDDSSELLEFSKLTAEGYMTTAISKCCGTPMCGTIPLYKGTTISVNADSCRVTTPSNIPIQAVIFASDIPEEHAETIVQHRSVPVLFAVYEQMESPTMQAFVAAVTEPISASANAKATTCFEKLCAAKPLTVDNACYVESRSR